MTNAISNLGRLLYYSSSSILLNLFSRASDEETAVRLLAQNSNFFSEGDAAFLLNFSIEKKFFHLFTALLEYMSDAKRKAVLDSLYSKLLSQLLPLTVCDRLYKFGLSSQFFNQIDPDGVTQLQKLMREGEGGSEFFRKIVEALGKENIQNFSPSELEHCLDPTGKDQLLLLPRDPDAIIAQYKCKTIVQDFNRKVPRTLYGVSKQEIENHLRSKEENVVSLQQEREPQKDLVTPSTPTSTFHFSQSRAWIDIRLSHHASVSLFFPPNQLFHFGFYAKEDRPRSQMILRRGPCTVEDDTEFVKETDQMNQGVKIRAWMPTPGVNTIYEQARKIQQDCQNGKKFYHAAGENCVDFAQFLWKVANLSQLVPHFGGLPDPSDFLDQGGSSALYYTMLRAHGLMKVVKQFYNRVTSCMALPSWLILKKSATNS